MALGATIHRLELGIADMDRGYYADHRITIARHPSESEERMMIRIIGFVLVASERLRFGPGLSEPDEPAISEQDDTGRFKLWMEVGQPEPRRLSKALGRADQVRVLSYGRSADAWWKQVRLLQPDNDRLVGWWLGADAIASVALLASRNMRLHCSVQDGELSVANGERTAELHINNLDAS